MIANTILVFLFCKLSSSKWINQKWKDTPYMVSIRMDGDFHLCGGSIISKSNKYNQSVILTAGHCIDGAAKVKIGCTHTLCTDKHVSTHEIASTLKHPDYGKGRGTVPNDVGLIFLSKPITHLRSTVIQLESDKSLFFGRDNAEIKISGYGGACNFNGCLGGSATDTLEYFITNHMPDIECAFVWGFSVWSENDFCIKDDTDFNGIDTTCAGDSGGPMIDIEHNTQAGIVSWGHDLCDPHLPSTGQFIPAFYEWIIDNIDAIIIGCNVNLEDISEVLHSYNTSDSELMIFQATAAVSLLFNIIILIIVIYRKCRSKKNKDVNNLKRYTVANLADDEDSEDTDGNSEDTEQKVRLRQIVLSDKRKSRLS